MKHPLKAADLHRSFSETPGDMKCSNVIDVYGKPRLDRAMWEAGYLAHGYLMTKGIDPTDAETYSICIREISDMLDHEFLPQLLAIFDQGQLSIQRSTKDELLVEWKEYDWVEKFTLFLQIVDQKIPHSSVNPNVPDALNCMVAVALLFRIDSAVMSESFDGSGLVENVMDIAAFRDRLNPPQMMKTAVEAAKKSARSEVGKAGAAARHIENRALKQEVFTWLDVHMKDFRSMDAATTEIVKSVVPIAWRTARDWVGEWKKLRSAGTA